MSEEIKQYVRSGNSAFASKNENYSDDANGCYRVILLRSLGYRETCKPEEEDRREITFAIGHSNEEATESRLTRKGYTVVREAEHVKHITDNIYAMCHIDIEATKDGRTVPYELKSVSSIRSHLKYNVKGHYKLNNLAQLVFNMLMSGKSEGKLEYTTSIFAPAGKETVKDSADGKKRYGLSWDKIEPCVKSYEVKIDFTTIIVDGVALEKYTVESVRDHILQSVQVIVDKEVSRIKPSSEACFFCGFKEVCKRFDSGEISSDEWVSIVTTTLCDKEQERHGV